MAFLGRYAHQDRSSMLQMTCRELRDLAEETAKLLEDENAALPGHTD